MSHDINAQLARKVGSHLCDLFQAFDAFEIFVNGPSVGFSIFIGDKKLTNATTITNAGVDPKYSIQDKEAIYSKMARKVAEELAAPAIAMANASDPTN
jgi:hypothetical protein